MIPGQKLTLSSAEQKMPLGTRYFDENTGKVYYYIKANEALTAGATLTPMLAIADGDCDASSGEVLNDAAVTFPAGCVGAFVKVNVGTNGIDDAPNRVISVIGTGNSNYLMLENAWSADLTTAEDYVVYHPFVVEDTDAAGERIVGVAGAAIASGEYGWMQSGGYCEAVKIIGGTDALAANEGIISSTTAGTGKGLTAAGTTADEADKANIFAVFGTALTQKVPAFLNCLP